MPRPPGPRPGARNGDAPTTAGRTDARAKHRVVASYDSRDGALRAVDHLRDEGFPAEGLSIVGGDATAERVTARGGYREGYCGGYAWAAITGLGCGAPVGTFYGSLFGLVFGLTASIDPPASGPALVLCGLVLGALLGTAIGLVYHSLSGGDREAPEVVGERVGRHSVAADEDFAEDARGMLKGLHGNLARERA